MFLSINRVQEFPALFPPLVNRLCFPHTGLSNATRTRAQEHTSDAVPSPMKEKVFATSGMVFVGEPMSTATALIIRMSISNSSYSLNGSSARQQLSATSCSHQTTFSYVFQEHALLTSPHGYNIMRSSHMFGVHAGGKQLSGLQETHREICSICAPPTQMQDCRRRTTVPA